MQIPSHATLHSLFEVEEIDLQNRTKRTTFGVIEVIGRKLSFENTQYAKDSESARAMLFIMK